jgi:hypothetical protein
MTADNGTRHMTSFYTGAYTLLPSQPSHECALEHTFNNPHGVIQGALELTEENLYTHTFDTRESLGFPL